MNGASWLEVGILLFIIMTIAFVAWRNGGRHAQGEGRLQADVKAMRGKVNEIEDRVELIEASAATKEDIARLEASVGQHAEDMKVVARDMAILPEKVAENGRAIEKIGEAIPDLESRQRAMNDKISDLQQDGGERASALKHVVKQVDRLYDVLVKRGVEQ